MSYFNATTFSYVTVGQMLAAGIVLPVVGIALVVLRFYIRIKHKQKVGADDYFNVVAVTLVTGVGISVIVGVAKKSLAYPTPAPPDNSEDTLLNFLPYELKTIQQVEFAIVVLSILALTAIKTSIVLFYRRVFLTGPKTIFNVVSIVTLIIVAGFGVAFFVGWLAGCGTHFSAHVGSRLDLIRYCPAFYGGFSVSILGADLAVDVIILAIPVPFVWMLRMPKRRKLAITGILLVGSAAVGASIARLVLGVEIAAPGLTVPLDEDLTISTIMYWYMVEAGVAQITSCLPTLWPLLRGQSVQSVVRSVRSLVSLSSSTHRQDRDADGAMKLHALEPARLHGVDHDAHVSEAEATDFKRRGTSPSPSNIHVRHDLSVSEGSV